MCPTPTTTAAAAAAAGRAFSGEMLWEELDLCPASTSGTTFLIVAYSTVIAVGLIGNTCLVFVISRQKEMRNVTNIFIANLSCSDILMGVVCLPVTVVYTLMDRWILGEALCKVTPFVQCMSVTVSIFSLVLIALERHQLILRPTGWKPAVGHSYLAVAVTWMVACFISLPFLSFHILTNAVPEPEHPVQPVHRPLRVHGALALRRQPAGLHHLPAAVPVLPAPGAHPRLLPAHLSAAAPAEGHGGARARGPEEGQGLPAREHHAGLHRGRLRRLLAAAHRVQRGVRLEPRGHLHLPAQRHLLRLPPHRHGVHLRQPHHLRLPQQQLPEGAEGHAAPLPLLGGARELRELPALHRQQRGHQGVVAEQRVLQRQRLATAA
ncbi:hypothetical protein AAFF_G00389180, partial [Aldrovandia affinis]